MNNKQLLEARIRKMVKTVMTENTQVDVNVAKTILKYAHVISAAPHIEYSTNDQTLIELAQKVSTIRMEMMEYVEQNSQYEFIPSGKGWKLGIKKGKK